MCWRNRALEFCTLLHTFTENSGRAQRLFPMLSGEVPMANASLRQRSKDTAKVILNYASFALTMNPEPKTGGFKMKGRSYKALEVPNAVRRSILLVDTDPCILALLKAMLEGQGYRVLLASCSETAMRIVTHSRLRINYLMTNVLDSQAPDLAARVQNLRPEMEIMFMSVIKERDAIR